MSFSSSFRPLLASSFLAMAATTKMPLFLLLLLLAASSSSFLSTLAQQQSYPSVFDTIDCTVHHPQNAGYLCSNVQPRCHTYAYYVVSSYLLQSPTGISTLADLATKLFGTTASALASASNIPSSHVAQKLTPGQLLFIPLDCTCVGKYSVKNVTYTIQPGDLFYKLANNSYEGLTTCQAMQDANPGVVVTDLQIGSTATFPLRCACPNQQQVNKGFKMLITYPVQEGDNISSVADMFGVAHQDFLAANNLTSEKQPIFPATTVLVPLQVKPPTPPSRSYVSPSTPPSPSSSSTSHTGLYVGIGVAVGVLALLFAVAACLFLNRKRRSKTKRMVASPEQSFIKEDTRQDKLLAGIKFANTEKVPGYTFQDLKTATQNFSPSHHIKGAVYRGVLKDRVVAIKKITRNVSQELQILQKVHHANLVTLLGVCMIGPEQSYLVYEYAENGSLNDWLHEKPKGSYLSPSSSAFLSWNARLQVALDVATGLQYIHDHTTPSFVHKDIKSSNILLDTNFRGKIANFGLAKSTDEMRQLAALTRHIVGTQGYMAPEYVTHGLVSPKVDVYAFGVVLLEMLSGEEAIIRDEEGGLVAGAGGFLSESIGPVLDGNDAKEKLKSWMDPVLRNAYPLDCAYQLAQLAQNCVCEDPDSRPSMRDAAYMLSKMLEISLEWESSGVLEQNYTENALEGR